MKKSIWVIPKPVLPNVPSGKLLAVDTETTGLSAWRGDRPFAVSICNQEGSTGYFRWEVDPWTRQIKRTNSFISNCIIIKKFLEEPSITKVFHNAKFDIRMMEMMGINVKGTVHDTMIAMHCLRTAEPSLKLKDLAKKYLGIDNDDEIDLQKATHHARREAKKKGWNIATEETHGKEPANADYWLAPPKLVEKYAVRDVERTMPLWMLLEEKMAEEGVRHLYDEEMELFWVTYRMEKRGVRIDPVVIESETKRNELILKKTGPAIDKIKKGLNVNSPKQMVQYLFKEQKHKILRYTCKCTPDSGRVCSKSNHAKNASVGTEILMAIDDPICKLVIEHKTAEKAVNGFFGRFKKLMVKEGENYILHPDFRQVGTVTGRFACADPNLQNVADPYGTRAPIPIPARMAFLPRPGYEWHHFDYKQMELWLFSSPKIANEEKMLSVLLSGEDLPSSVAIEMGWGDQLQKDKETGRGVTRIRVKLMLYGIVYGIGPFGLSLLNKIPYQEARNDLDTFKRKYPKIDRYMQDTIKKASHYGFVQGPLGRKIQTNRDTAYKGANYIVQNSSAHILKKAMIDTDKWLRQNKIDGHLILTIHDELAFEIHKRHANMYVIKTLKKIMGSYGKHFGIPPLPIDVERVRENWMKKEEVDL